MKRVLLISIVMLAMIKIDAQDLTSGKLKIALQNSSFVVDDIAKHNVVESSTVGFAGSRSDQYSRFAKWVKSASEDELLRMTDHTSAVVRVYAFWGLIQKGSPFVREVYQNHKEDTAEVQTMMGCIMDVTTVYSFMGQLLQNN